MPVQPPSTEALSRTHTPFLRPQERPFLKEERDDVTVLFGGLTSKHDVLVQAGMESQGYSAKALPIPDRRSYEIGREYGNNGQCNPTYFTVGNLVKFLQSLEAKGMSRSDIVDKYVFFTAGACGPCRFGMYEAEYRLAVENAGFHGFRVLIVGRDAGLRKDQQGANQGLDMNLELYLSMLGALMLGDLINDIGFRLRPFEIEKGSVDRLQQEALEEARELIRNIRVSEARRWEKLYEKKKSLATYLWFFTNEECLAFLERFTEKIRKVKLDRLRCRPRVKVTGEFWAQTTEGDGNFRMFDFLESQGAEVLVDPITNYLMHMMYQAKVSKKENWNLHKYGEKKSLWVRLKTDLIQYKKMLRSTLLLTFMEKVFSSRYKKMRTVWGDLPQPLPKQHKFEELAAAYYRPFVGGGESHLEVGKNIYYQKKNLAHMVLAIKPFGCLPSTQSDGVQSAVVSHNPDLTFLPIETSGDGEVNAHSRVQMALSEAKLKAKEEYNEVLESTGYTLAQVRTYCARHPEFQDPLFEYSRSAKFVGGGAQFLAFVTERMREGGVHPKL